MSQSNSKKFYAFLICECKLPHWKEGKIIKTENDFVFLEGCPQKINKKNLFTNKKDALIAFVKEMDKCRKKNISGIYGKNDLIAYANGKKLLETKKAQKQ